MATTVVAAGGLVLATDMNNALTKRVASVSLTANSANVTTIAVVATVTANLVAGMTYSLRWEGRISSSVSNAATELSLIRIKPGTTTAGTDMNVTQICCATNSSAGFSSDLYAEWTAATTGSQSFVVTIERTTSPAATGTFNVRASTTGPAYFLLDSLGI